MVDDRLVRVGNVIGIVGILCAVALAVVFALPSAIGAEASYVVLSDSMQPTFAAGDIVVVNDADRDGLSEGDIISFETSDTTRVTHRIVDVEQTDEGIRYRTKGDANEDPDTSLVAPAQVIGTVWFHIPLVGRLVVFAGTSMGTVALVVVPAVLLVVNEIYSLYTDAVVEEPEEELP